eukprot:7552747-Ditylum_brightwellii.AAC.1
MSSSYIVNEEYLKLAEAAAVALESRCSLSSSFQQDELLKEAMKTSPTSFIAPQTSPSSLKETAARKATEINPPATISQIATIETPSASAESNQAEKTSPAVSGDANNQTTASPPKTTPKTTACPTVKRSKKNGTKKKQKSVNPFRVKLNCIAAIRYGKHLSNTHPTILPSTGNTNNHAHRLHLWAQPLPGLDDGLALVGKRIRCIFPKPQIAKFASSHGKKKFPRILEGEVVSLLQHSSQYQRVQMLIPKQTLQSMPFLTPTAAEDDQDA